MLGKTLFIVNPISGKAAKRKAIDQLKIDLDYDANYDIRETEHSGHATQLAHEAKDHYQNIIVVGGDGTINEVVTGIQGSDIALGIIPRGSGNGLANHLGIPSNYHKALDLIRNNSPKSIDLISVNSRFVVNVGGIGFDGHVANLFNKSSNRGLVAYMKLILGELLTYQEFNFEVESDEYNTTGKAFIIAIANATEFGNRFIVAPKALHNDGKLDLVIIRKPPFFKLIWLFIQGYRGKLAPSKYYNAIPLEKAKVSFIDTIAHVDGELDENNLTSPIHLKIIKNGLKVYY